MPVFARYLVRLADMLRLAEEHAATREIDPQTVPQARLAPDMLGFRVTTAYAILRHIGAPLGKAKCDGLRMYDGPTTAA